MMTKAVILMAMFMIVSASLVTNPVSCRRSMTAGVCPCFWKGTLLPDSRGHAFLAATS